jgi:hypothetical protein
MADKKISQLTAKGSRIVASDRVPIAQDDGGGTFSTKYVLGSEVHNWSLNKESASYTLLLTDAHNYVEMEVSSANINNTYKRYGCFSYRYRNTSNAVRHGTNNYYT